MKKIFQILMLSAMTIMFVFAAPNVAVFAQDTAAGQCADEVKTKLYDTFKNNRKGDANDDNKDLTMRKAAFDAANEFITKCPDPANEAVAKVMQKYISEYPTYVADKGKAAQKTGLEKDIAKAYEAKDYSTYFAKGKQYIAAYPEGFALQLYMVSNGYSFSVTDKNDTYNSETINLAKDAIAKIKSGSTSPDWKPFNSKDDALAKLNYIVGSILYKQNGKEKDAAPFFYEAAKYQSEVKNDPAVYNSIAYVYTQEYAKAAADYKAKCVDVTCPEEEAEKSLAQLRGIADRVLDSYARALTVAKSNPKTPAATVTKYTETAQKAYKARFDSDAGFDAYIKGVSSKPLTDPTTPIAPIEAAPKPATTTTAPGTTTTTTPGTGTAATTTTVTKPTDAARPRTTGNNGAAAAATATKPAATTPAATTTKPAAKPAAKPAPKKPGI